nr:DUF4271 domain-containing protein [Membranihabitans maritimus]
METIPQKKELIKSPLPKATQPKISTAPEPEKNSDKTNPLDIQTRDESQRKDSIPDKNEENVVLEDQTIQAPGPEPQLEERIPENKKNKEPIISFTPRELNTVSSSEYWVYIFDLIILFLVTGLFMYDREIFGHIRKASVHENYLRFLYRDFYLRKSFPFWYLNLLYLLGLGFIIYKTGVAYSFSPSFGKFLIILLAVCGLFSIKHLVLKFLASLIEKPFEVKFYQYWTVLYSGLIGVVLIPIILMLSFFPSSFLSKASIGVGFILLLFLGYRQVKALIHGRFYLSKHLFQIFLYFCAVEIIPIFLVFVFLTPF